MEYARTHIKKMYNRLLKHCSTIKRGKSFDVALFSCEPKTMIKHQKKKFRENPWMINLEQLKENTGAC